MHDVILTPLCLSFIIRPDLFVFSPVFLPFFPCFLLFGDWLRLFPFSFFLLLDFFLQSEEFFPPWHFLLLLPSWVNFLLVFFGFLRLGSALLCTIWCLDSSALASFFEEEMSFTLLGLAVTDRIVSPRTRSMERCKVQWCFMFPEKERAFQEENEAKARFTSPITEPDLYIQNIYMTGFSGQKFYTVKVCKLRLIILIM